MPQQGGSVVVANNLPLAMIIERWRDSEITFTLPTLRPDGSTWGSNEVVNIGLIVGGVPSNELSFLVDDS
jgi:hypothetical protein